MRGAGSDEMGAAQPPVGDSGPAEGVSGEPGESPEGGAGAGSSSDEMGNADTPEPTTKREPPETDPELKDSGEPADGQAPRLVRTGYSLAVHAERENDATYLIFELRASP